MLWKFEGRYKKNSLQCSKENKGKKRDPCGAAKRIKEKRRKREFATSG
jgi:hypothetical protein